MTDTPAPDTAATEQRRVERERIVAYLAHHESGARAKAEAATTEESARTRPRSPTR